MNDLANPHDRFFKEVFSRPETAADFLANYLPPDVAAALDVSAPELVKESFIDPDLQEHFSDLLYRIQLVSGGEAFAYLLFEHKSWSYEFTALQLLRYEVRVWEQKLREKTKRLPLIIPIVLHHGRSPWRASLVFETLVEGADNPALEKYVPRFEYHLCDLSSFDENQIKGAAMLRVALSTLKYVFSEDLGSRLTEIFSILRQMPEQSALEFLYTVLKYLSVAAPRVTSNDLTESLATAFPEEEGGLMQTLAEQWIQQGVQQGVQQGLQQGLAGAALRRLRRQFGALDEQKQNRISTLPTEKLEQLDDDLFDFKTIEDLDAWLATQAGESDSSDSTH